MRLSPLGYITALEDLADLWTGGDASTLSFPAALAADETGLVN